MTSKRELRAEIDRLNRHIDGREECWMHAFDDGCVLAAELIASPRPGPNFAPWAEHLARVADAAKAEGYREGYGQACEDAHERQVVGSGFQIYGPSGVIQSSGGEVMEGEIGVRGTPDQIAASLRRYADQLSPKRPQPEPEATPDPVEPAGGQLQRFSVNGYRNSQGEWIKCGCRLCNPEARWMVVCGECGNKRCPRAQDHANLCTRSNEPGQVASACGYICACPAIPSAWAPGSMTR